MFEQRTSESRGQQKTWLVVDQQLSYVTLSCQLVELDGTLDVDLLRTTTTPPVSARQCIYALICHRPPSRTPQYLALAESRLR